jgi:glycine/D-amino acid oxidase-like deaminating enzyme
MNEPEARELQLYHKRIRMAGADCRFFHGPEACGFEPLLGPHVVAALHDPADFHVNPYRLCEGYLNASLHRGGRIVYGVTVRDVTVRKNRIDRVITDRGDYHADWVVAAAGAWTPQIFQSMRLRLSGFQPMSDDSLLSEIWKLIHIYEFVMI